MKSQVTLLTSAIAQCYKFIQALSIDVALGACVMSFLVAQVIGVHLPWSIYAILFTTVWAIYTGDHLIDAHEVKGKATTFRHALHQHYYTSLKRVLILAVLLLMMLASTIPESTLKAGAGLLLGVVSYFAMLRRLPGTFHFLKELNGAFLYGLGVAVGPLSISASPWEVENGLLLAQIILLAYGNLLLFAFYEAHSDRTDGHISSVTQLGERVVRYLILVVLLSFLIIQLLHPQWEKAYYWVLWSMWVTLGLLWVMPSYFGSRARFRFLGDFIFLYPLVLLISDIPHP